MASKTRSNAIAQLLLTRVAAVEAFIFAILLGLAVNIASTLLTDAFKEYPVLLGVVSAILFLAVVLWLAIKISAEVATEDRWEAVLGIEPGVNNLIDLLVYPFSRDVFRYIQATFVKDKNLLRQWRECEIIRVSPSIILGPGYGSISKSRIASVSPRSCTVAQVVEGAVETLVLEIIADSLQDYCSDAKKALWSKVPIENVRSVMAGNHTFAAISTSSQTTGGGFGAIYTVGHNGEMFWAPEIALPAGARISRTESGAILLSTERIKIEFKAEFPGANHFEGPEFERIYLGRQPGKTELFKVYVSTKLTVSARGLFDFSEWWEREWLEVLVDCFRARIDFEDFKKRVNFEAALVQRKMLMDK